MRVKRYVVDSMPDALQRIRSDLGKDAVILNTKEVKSGGIFGFFSRKQIEVIAAIDSISIDSASQPPLDLTQSAQNASHHLERRPTSQAGSSILESASTNISSVAVMQLNSEVSSMKTFEKEIESKATNVIQEDLMDEIKQMKSLMFKLVNQNNQTENRSEFISKIETQMLNHEFDPILIQEILQHSLEKADVPIDQLTEKEVYQLVKSELRSRIGQDQHQGICGTTKIVNFVGPTGVGKTTSIAKLAAEQVLKHRKKVGFITSDTYRIAAVEQLKTYATILNVPLEVVYSPQDLKKSLDKLKDCDLIFMDTAGRNFRNEMYVSELNSLLKVHENSETYLVLSLTMKYKDMKAVTENFSKFKLDKVLFTKQDETDSYGSVFNILEHFSLKLSYVANGQNVPDDISKLNIDELVEQILEEKTDE